MPSPRLERMAESTRTEAEARDEAFRAHMRSCRRLLAEAKRVRYSPSKHAETLALCGELRRFAARTHAETVEISK